MKNKVLIFLALLIAFSINIARAQTVYPVSYTPIPHATISGTQSICAGQPAQITISLTGGTVWRIIWNDGTTQHIVNNITTNPYVLTLYPTQTTAYWIDSVSNEYLCPSTGTGVALVTVNPLPTVFTISTINNYFCQNTSGTINQAWADAGITYELLNGGVPIASIQPTTNGPISFTNITVFGAPLYVRATNPITGCSAMMNGSVTFIQDPLPLAAGTISGLPAICTDQQTTYSIAAIPNATSYEWTIPVGMSFVSGQGTTTITVKGVSAQNNGSIVVRGKNTCNYGPPSSMTVVIKQKPTATILSNPTNDTICSGQSIGLLANGGTSATWYPGAISGSTYNPSPTSDITYTTIVSDNGCTDTAQITVIVNPTPTVSISTNPFNGEVCQGQSATLSASGADTYIWVPGLYTLADYTVTPSTGTHTYTVTGTSGGCTASASTSIVVYANPSINITPANPAICDGENITLTATQISGANYVWNIGGNGSYSNTQSPSNTTTYMVTVTDLNACHGSAQTTVTVNPNPNVTASSNSPICSAGGVIHLDGSSNIGGTYGWTGPGFTSSTPSPTINNPGTWMSGNYTLTVTTGAGCTGSATITVDVNDPPSLFINSNETVLCQGSLLQLISVTSAPAGHLTWSGPGGFSSSDPNPEDSDPHTGNYIAHVDYDGCIVDSSIYITVNPLPTVVFNTPGTGYFVNTDPQVLLTGSPAGGIFSGMGVFNGYFYPVVAGNGTWVLTYEYTDGNGCTNSATQTVIVGSTGVDENASSKISLYPNPVSDVLNINVQDLKITGIQLFDGIGKLITTFPGETKAIDFSAYSHGMYFVQFTTENGDTLSPFKVIK